MLPLAQLEAQVVRLARAYSPDRGNLMIEGSLEPIWDGPEHLPNNTRVLPFATDASFYRRCMNTSYTRQQLHDMLPLLRDGDIIRHCKSFHTLSPFSVRVYILILIQ
jgi:hypothetical protein